MFTFDAPCPTSFSTVNFGLPEQGGAQRLAGERRLDEYLDTVEAAVHEVFQFARSTAQRLADSTVGRNRHDADYYLRMIFNRGAFLHPLPPAVPHFLDVAALSGESSNSLRDPPGTNSFGNAATAEYQSREQFREVFDSLTGERKRTLYDFLMAQGAGAVEELAVQSPPSHRAQDFDDVFRIIKGLCRCGIDGFVCLVKSNDTYQLRPQWFFSSPGIDHYLARVVGRWDAGVIGLRLEAFSESGCNMDALLRAPWWYPKWLRHEIREKIDILLAQATGLIDVKMEYDDYEKAILVDLGVELVGWTHETWACPSKLPLEVEPLQTLLEAVKIGKCHFRRLAKEEHAQCVNEYVERVIEKSREQRRRRRVRKMAHASGN
ncbi:hypothetical protein LXA43DRAFT_1065555 [Ganoderma leucocontextum]|nr:hypothetical protein LXA43DRAFT_1065555 [Ganoderma leucocontextum]